VVNRNGGIRSLVEAWARAYLSKLSICWYKKNKIFNTISKEQHPRPKRPAPALLPLPPLAPSPRIVAYLARKGLLNQGVMALTTVDPGLPPLPAKEDLPPPPKVAITPCDPWPRPYYLEEGLRRVKPYHFTYNTNAKERWRDREVLDVFSSEFRDREAEYYVCFQVSWTIPRLIL
jgi:hypothetical protein